jgi:hypothetical protein
MDNTAFITSIIDGSNDDFLDQFSQAIKVRKLALKGLNESILKVQLAPGTRVRFISTTKPKYLAGREATVVKINPKKVVVKVDEPTDPWFDKGKMLGQKINTPLSLIELV